MEKTSDTESNIHAFLEGTDDPRRLKAMPRGVGNLLYGTAIPNMESAIHIVIVSAQSLIFFLDPQGICGLNMGTVQG